MVSIQSKALGPISPAIQKLLLWVSFFLLPVCVSSLHFACASGSPSSPVTLWAWERREDVRFTAGKQIDISYFAGCVHIRRGRAYFRPRTQALLLPPEHASPMPVFRIDSDAAPASQTAVLVDQIIQPIKEHVIRSESRRVQLDFDARESERPLYRMLFNRLKAELPAGTKLSITALASWCLDDRWLDDIAADEVVVMLFSMGRGRDQVLESIKRHHPRAGRNTELAIGISANESYTNSRLRQLGIFENGRRIYVFNSLPWSEARLKRILKEVI